MQEEFEDTKRVIRIRISKKDIHCKTVQTVIDRREISQYYWFIDANRCSQVYHGWVKIMMPIFADENIPETCRAH